MTISRQTFQINTDTGTQGDTGKATFGQIVQVTWRPTTADTGGDLYLVALPVMGDTAGGMLVLNDNDCLGAQFSKQPTIPQTHVDGFDTGAALDIPRYVAGERLRVKVTPGGAAVVGTVAVYIDDKR